MIVLESERLLFREHEPADLTVFCALEADAGFRRHVGGNPRSREEAERRFREVFLRPVTSRLRLWATVFKPDGCYVGYCGVYGGASAHEGVLGYYLAPAYWGRGLASEAGRAFVDFGFDELGLTRIVASVEPTNAASVRVLDKLGFSSGRREVLAHRIIDHYELRSV